MPQHLKRDSQGTRGRLDAGLINRIRAIFLHPEPRVTIAEAAGILVWSRAEMDAAIGDGEIEVVETGAGKRIEMRELAGWALQRWAVTTIEEALGGDAARILPPPLRTRRLTVRLPRYQIDALKVLAEDAHEPVDAILTRAVEDLPDLDRDRLSRLVPRLRGSDRLAGDRKRASGPAETRDPQVIRNAPHGADIRSVAATAVPLRSSTPAAHGTPPR